MKFGAKRSFNSRRALRGAGFTLAEVLAALVFMAIVIPVIIEAMHIASRAGTVAARKSEAALVAQRVLSENLVMTNWTQGNQSGIIAQGRRKFNYELKSDPWAPDGQNAIRQLTATVHFSAQNRDFTVSMATLVDTTVLTGTNGTQ